MFKIFVVSFFICVILCIPAIAESPNTNGLLLDYEKAIEINTTYLNNISSRELKLCIKDKDQLVKDLCIKKFNRVNSKLIKLTIEILDVKTTEKTND